MAGSIIEVRTVDLPVCPIYDYVKYGSPAISTNRRTYFSTSAFSLWSTGQKETRPCALPADGTTSQVSLWFHLNDKKALQAGTDWKFEARLEISPEKSFLFEPVTGKWDASTIKGVTANIAIPKGASGDPISLPWAFVGSLIWKITGSGPDHDSLVGEGHFPIELYVVSKHIPLFMKRDGIPLDLLRFPRLLPEWMKGLPLNMVLPLGWSSFVTNQLFHDSRMNYNSWFGQAAYCGSNWEGTSLNTTSIIWMDLWLSDMNGIEKRQSKEKYSVNCSDLATLTAAISSLGLKDGETQLHICSVDQKFYINKTHLIGTHKDKGQTSYTDDDLCNNPFYGTLTGLVPKLLVDATNGGRTYFSNHQFVVQANAIQGKTPMYNVKILGTVSNPKVLDSCAGPHLGLEDLKLYIANTVDNETANYWLQQAKPGERPTQQVDADKINKDVELIAMAPRPAIIRSIAKQDLPVSLYRSMMEMFSQDPYKVMEPIEGFTDPHSISIIATWTVQQKASDSNPEAEYHVNISRYFDSTSVQEAYKRRKSKLKTGEFKEDVKNPPNGLYCKIGSGYYMFWVQVDATKEKGQCYLVTIDGSPGFDAIGKILKTKLQTLGKEEDAKKVLEIESIDCPPEVKVNQEFVAKIKFTAQSSTWWHAAMGQPMEKSVMLIDAASNEQNADGSITMKFLAIKEGYELIQFSIYGQNLDWTLKTHKLLVTK